MSDFLQPHGLYSPWNPPGQNTGVGGLSLLQGIFPTKELNPGLPHCQLSHQGSPRILEWVADPFTVDLPDPGIELWSPALQADSLPTELSRKPSDLGSILGLGRSPVEGNSYPLQYSGLENSMDRGAWWAIVHGVAKSWTRLSVTHTHMQDIMLDMKKEEMIDFRFLCIKNYY